MGSISIGNLNRPTSAKWGKVQAVCLFISSTIMGSALSMDNHILGWVSWGLTLVAGLIPILTNGVAPENKEDQSDTK